MSKIEIFDIPIKYVKTSFYKFSFIKDNLINYFDNIYPNTTSSNITKTDWEDCGNNNREWVKYILPLLNYNLINMVKPLGYNEITFSSVWFQQYSQNSFHRWHTHSSHYTGAFYIELPEGTPKTQLKFGEEIIEIEAKEGEIVIFPSFVVHSSPPNNSPYRKSIISFNIDLKDPYDFD